MMGRKFIIIFLIVFAAVAVLVYSRFQKQHLQSDFLTLYGNVDVRQVDLGFRVSGRVVAMPYQEGDLISPGTLLAELDNQPYFDLVNQAQGNLDSIKANLTYAEKVLARRRELSAANDGSISQEDYENASANYSSLQASLQQSEAALGVSKTNLSDTKVYAPAEGTILTRIREPGSVVREGDPVYTLSLLSPVWIRAFVSEEDLGVIYPGMEAEIFTDTPGGIVYKGQIGFISPVSEFTPKTVQTTQLRTDLVYRLRVIADNPDRRLKQGMPVTVRLKKQKKQQS